MRFRKEYFDAANIFPHHKAKEIVYAFVEYYFTGEFSCGDDTVKAILEASKHQIELDKANDKRNAKKYKTKQERRKNISTKLRFEIFERDCFTCQYCGRKSPEVVLSIDHIKPISKGGTNEKQNLITACLDCNKGKGTKILEGEK